MEVGVELCTGLAVYGVFLLIMGVIALVLVGIVGKKK